MEKYSNASEGNGTEKRGLDASVSGPGQEVVFGNAIENIRVPQNENFLAIRELISFSENAFALRS